MSLELFDISSVEDFLARGYTLLTPNQRLARAIRAAWDARCLREGRRVWEPAAALSLHDWLDGGWRDAVRTGRVASRLRLSREQELFIWQQVIEQQQAQVEGSALIHTAAAAELASQARDRLLLWDIPVNDTHIKQRFRLESDCSTFYDWLQAFESQLQANAWATQGDCLRDLAGLDIEAPARQVALVFLGDVAPLERRALGRLCADIQAVPLAADLPEIVVHGFPEQRQELASAAAWARRMFASRPEDTVGIVLADTGEQRVALDYLLRREFDCIGRDYYSLPVNFSTGIGLSRAPAARDALGVLDLLSGRVTVPAVVQLLHSRFLRLPDAGSESVCAFIRELYRRGSEEIGTATLRNMATTANADDAQGLVLGDYLLAMSGMRELQGKHSPSAWAELFSHILDTWGWPGDGALDSLEYQQVTLWYRTVERFRALDGVAGLLDATTAVRMLRQSCDQQVSHPQTLDSRIQVLGPLEAVGLAFDHLWICGVQGGAWPSPPRPNPFIPLSLQAPAGMPHATPEREWDFSETLLRQYRAACGEVRASYSRQVNGAPELPSGLLAGFTEEPLDEVALLDPSWPAQSAAAIVESVLEIHAPQPAASELATLRGGSALIEDQSQCPFRAFARRRLSAEPLGDFVVGIAPTERGGMVHEALQYLWSQIDSHAALITLDDQAQAALVSAAAQAAIQWLRPARRADLGHACLELELEYLEALLHEWLAVESARGEFTVQALEEPIQLSLSQLQVSLRV
ncbi:MAG: hypothetical protein ACPG1A_09650, partial [Halioglobus sp.]